MKESNVDKYLQKVHDYVFCDSMDNIIECKEKELTMIIDRDVKNGFFNIQIIYDLTNSDIDCMPHEEFNIIIDKSITYSTICDLIKVLMG